MGRNYGLPTMGVWATYMGLTNLRVTVGQAEETDWKRYKPAFVLSSCVLLLLLHTTFLQLEGGKLFQITYTLPAGCFVDLSDVHHLSWIYK